MVIRCPARLSLQTSLVLWAILSWSTPSPLNAQQIDLTKNVKGLLPIANAGCNASTAAQCLLNIGGIGPATVDNLANKTLIVPRLGSYVVGFLPSAATAGSGAIAAVIDSLAIGDCTVGGGGAVTLCRSNGTVWSAFGDGGSGGGGGGTPFRSSLFSSSTTWSLSQATHGQGTINAVVCRDPSLNTFVCAEQDDGSGNITVRHGVATSGYLDVFGSGGGGGGGGGGAPTTAQYILQVPNGTLTGAQALSVLATGLMKNTFATGVVSIAVAADLPTHASRHQNGGNDEVATATPGANAIPKAGAGGTLASGWLPLSGVSAGTIGGISGSVISMPTIAIDLTGRITSQSVTSTQFVRTVDTPTTLDVSGSFASGLTVAGIGGTALSPLGSGILKLTAGVPSLATAATVISLWTGPCNSTTFLRGDNQCATPPGGGTVSSTGTSAVGNVPSWNNTSGTQLAPGYAVASTTSANSLVQRDAGGSIFGSTVQAASYITAVAPADNLFAGFFRRHSATQTEQIVVFANEFGTAMSGINPDGSFSGNSFSATTLSTVLAATLGGTGQTSGPSGGILYWNSATSIAGSAMIAAGMPLIGGGTGGAPSAGSKTGNTTQLASWTGATTAARCVHTDVNGNLTVAAADCGTGAGNVNAASATTVGNYPAWTSTTGDISPAGTAAASTTTTASTLVSRDSLGATRLRDKGGYRWDVTAYGATGNGSTDDTASIKSAITDAEAVGGVVFFPPGVYCVSDSGGSGDALFFGNGVEWASVGSPGSESTKKTIFLEGAGTTRLPAQSASTIKWCGSNPGITTNIVHIKGPMLGGGLRNITLDSNSRANVRFSYVAHVSYGEWTNVDLINNAASPGVYTRATVPSMGYGNCNWTWTNVNFQSSSANSSGILFDNSTLGQGLDSCGSKFIGGDWWAGGTSGNYAAKIVSADNLLFIRTNFYSSPDPNHGGAGCGVVFAQATVNAGLPYENHFFANTAHSGWCGTAGNGQGYNTISYFGLGDCQANCDPTTSVTNPPAIIGTDWSMRKFGSAYSGTTTASPAWYLNNSSGGQNGSGTLEFRRAGDPRMNILTDIISGMTFQFKSFAGAGTGALVSQWGMTTTGILFPGASFAVADLPTDTTGSTTSNPTGGHGGIIPDGSQVPCSNCTVGGATCAASGGTVGIMAQYWGGAWRCNR